MNDEQQESNTPQRQDDGQLAATATRSYAAPQLRYLGSVRELTLTTTKPGGRFDGGFTPQV